MRVPDPPYGVHAEDYTALKSVLWEAVEWEGRGSGWFGEVASVVGKGVGMWAESEGWRCIKRCVCL